MREEHEQAARRLVKLAPRAKHEPRQEDRCSPANRAHGSCGGVGSQISTNLKGPIPYNSLNLDLEAVLASRDFDRVD